jgi:hypothetical protein
MPEIPDFTDLANYRYNSFTNAVTPKLIGYGAIAPEIRTIPNTAPYTILLHESPQLNTPSTTVITDTTTATILEEVSKTTVPGNNQFRVNYDERGNGQAEFNANQKGHGLSIKYYGEGSIQKKENYQATLDEIQAQNIINVSSDLVLTVSAATSDVLLLVNPSASRVTITLYGLAGNTGNVVRVVNLNDGITRILRAGTDTIDDGVNNATEVSIHGKGDNIKLYASSAEWVVNKLKDTISTGWVNCSDWTNVHLGTVDINVNAGSTPLGYEMGELVSDTTSGGRIIKIVDNLDGTGTITVYQCTTGGTFINGNTLTGANSLATSTVNGNTKNVDSNFYHGLGISLLKLIKNIHFSTGATEATIFTLEAKDFAGAGYNSNFLGIDTDNIKFQTHANGAGAYVDDAGNNNALDTDDYYYDMIIERVV